MRQTFWITFILLLLGAPCANALDAAKIAAVENAASDLVALAGDSARTGLAPRQTDPRVKRLLDTVFDTSELQRSPVQSSDIDGLSRWSMAAVKTGLIYILAGSGYTDISTIPDDAATAEKLNANAAKFAPEMGLYFDAVIRLEGAMLDAARAILSEVPENRNEKIKSGVAKIRLGVAQTINGVITTLPVAGLTDKWRRERLAVLAEIAPKAAGFLLPEHIAALRKSASATASELNDPGVKEALNSFARALASQ